jgi:hypothetical protein
MYWQLVGYILAYSIFLLFGISRLIGQWSLIFGKIRVALLLADGSLS